MFGYELVKKEELKKTAKQIALLKSEAKGLRMIVRILHGKTSESSEEAFILGAKRFAAELEDQWQGETLEEITNKILRDFEMNITKEL